jgi:cell division transport system permease protein
MGLRNIRTNRTMSAASVLVLISCLMLIGLVFLIAVNLNAVFGQFSSRNVIMVYLNPGLDNDQIGGIEQHIRALPNVKDCVFISSEEAYQRVKAQNDGAFELLEGTGTSFLPAGFEVSPIRMDEFGDTVTTLEHIDPGVASVRSFQDVAKKLSAVERALMIFGAAVIGILMLVSVFIISSTVRATMFSRQQEINVMKSVGASQAFIRWPFLVEGVVLGVLGAMFALLVVFLVYALLASVLRPFFSNLLGGGFQLESFTKYLIVLLPGFLGLGVLTGGGGSMLSITRYLKEQVLEEALAREHA